jgi:thioredoxin reductase
MPAHEQELQEALEEGIKVKWLSTIKAADGESITVEKMRLNSAGLPEPTGEFETIEADSVVLALGQDTDLDFLRNVQGLEFQDGLVKVDANMMTGCPGIFAGGDVVPSERTATVAIGHGRKAVSRIRCLRSEFGVPAGACPGAGIIRSPQHLVLHRCSENDTAGARFRAQANYL